MTKQFKYFLMITLTSFSTLGFAENAINQCWAESTDHPEVYTCLAKKVALQQQILVNAYEKAQAAVESFAPANPTLSKHLLVELANSRKNFEAYQKMQCQLAMDAAGGGSGAGDVKAGCMIDLSKSQTALLVNYMGAGS